MRIYFIGLLLFLSWSSFSQDSKVLSQQMDSFFKELRPSDRKELVEQCVETWNSSFYSLAEKDTILITMKRLQALRLAVNPDIVNFSHCVNTFCKRGEKDNYNVWLAALKNVMQAKERRRNLIQTYLEQTSRIIYEQVLFAASTHKWIGRGKYIWQFSPDLNVVLSGADIVCKTPKDSIIIEGGNVSLNLNSAYLKGQGGKVTWLVVKDTVYAELANWTADMNASDYTADSVYFNYGRKYAIPIFGKLKDNASKYKRDNEDPYPEFTSYSTSVVIDSVFPAVSFKGGIIYAGSRFLGFGNAVNPACIHVTPNDTFHLYAYSSRFAIDSVRILGNSSQINIPLHQGGFSHNDVNFVYTKSNHTVTLKRITEQSLHIPFKDDYHQILFDVEQIVWPVDSVYMEMSMSNRSGLFKATIESFNFFSNAIFDDIQGLDDINPLNALEKVARQLNSDVFTTTDYAEQVKRPIDQLRKQLILLSYNDFLEYNPERDMLTLKQRLFDYTDARAGRKDYDDIRFYSHPDIHQTRINARLDLRNYDLRIFGVEKFTISQKKDIYVEPSDKCVVMKKNRDMEFNGKLKAGMFDMYGTNLYFSYDKYKINLTHVDSTGMFLADKGTGKRGVKVNSMIRDVTGDILIDKPGNKSGKDVNVGFPVLNSTQESYVYFDDPEIRNGAYKRDSFYFVVKPYTLKDINDGSKVRYAFRGTLISGIVPDINDTLLLMKDNTLGMNYKTPANGLRLYNKGNIKSRIMLSRKGFVADGDVRLNGVMFQSPEIALLPDSMLAETKLLNVAAIPDIRPDARGEQVVVRYFRKAGNLQATSTVKPFDIYKGHARHEGKLFIYDQLMNAAGVLNVKDASMKSQLFQLESENILSDRTDLALASLGNKNIQLNTSNVRADIDMVNNKGKFMNNADANQAQFPSNRYRCTFKSFTWYMNEAYLNIGIEDPGLLKRLWHIEVDSLIPPHGRNMFVSTDKKNDSLSFIAPLAKYDLKSGDIQCLWVNHIDVANGRFYPDKGDVYIGSNGDIKEFTKSRLLCERTDSTRHLTNVTFKLVGRYKFNGSGDYDYVNEDKVTKLLHFAEIGTDTARCLFAKADVLPEDAFKLNSGFNYKGNIFLYSREPDLFFRGYVGLSADASYLAHTWMKVNTYFRASHITIPVVVENRDDNNQRIFNGMYLNVDKTTRPYAAFMSRRTFYNDDLIIGGQGSMVWNSREKRYLITDTLADRHYYVTYQPEKNTVSAYGKLDLNTTCPGVVQRSVGQISYNLKEEQLKLSDVLYAVDFELLKKMEAVLLKDLSDKRKTITVDSSLIAKLHTMYGKAAIPAVDKQLARSSNNIPDSLGHLLVLDSLSFTWNPERKSYRAEGSVNVLSVRKKPIEKSLNITMEVRRRRVGDEFYIYLYNDNLWYYFEYTGKTLYTLSSNEEYNSILQNEKADKKIILDANKLVLYTITLCPDSKRQRFLKAVAAKTEEEASEEKKL